MGMSGSSPWAGRGGNSPRAGATDRPAGFLRGDPPLRYLHETKPSRQDRIPSLRRRTLRGRLRAARLDRGGTPSTLVPGGSPSAEVARGTDAPRPLQRADQRLTAMGAWHGRRPLGAPLSRPVPVHPLICHLGWSLQQPTYRTRAPGKYREDWHTGCYSRSPEWPRFSRPRSPHPCSNRGCGSGPWPRIILQSRPMVGRMGRIAADTSPRGSRPGMSPGRRAGLLLGR